MQQEKKTALIAVDVQKDFLPGGALGVPAGDQVIEPLLRAAGEVDVFVATRDWHPENHCSFEVNGGIWPVHCVAETDGAQISRDIEARADFVIDKATQVTKDAYSGFQDTDLADRLRNLGVTDVIIGGLATDYCVKATALDAKDAGFGVTVLKAASRAVNINPNDENEAILEMQEKGILIKD